MSRFPAEIIGQFLLHINEDTEQVENLRSCSLVSQTWCSITQPFLYNRVVLNLEEAEEASSLADILSKSPHIRAYIRHLILTEVSNLGPIVAFLDPLPSLESLQLQSYSRPYNLATHGEGVVALEPLLSSRCLTSLRLSDIIDFPVQLLRPCLALEHLAIRHVTFSTSGLDADDAWRLFLKSLLLSTGFVQMSEPIDWLLSPVCPFDLSRLETFIGLDKSGVNNVYESHCRFISHVSPSLKTVLISPPNSSIAVGHTNPLGILQPQRLRVISSITITVRQDPDPSENVNTLPWLIAFLSGLPNPETLHDLTLNCDLWYEDYPHFTSISEGWLEIDALLNRFHNLKRVHVECYDEADEEMGKDLASWLFTQLPTSHNRGILSIEYSDDHPYMNSLEGWVSPT
ncbi:hypothetical protein BDN72DRAFT_848328 [Pluteus cervinus]|uniref:Uncharacterized protein n=1 Tax=Pluteus cervinus TaxID=181527 RepID=A0ACD3AAY8_9AGAR|nr:hypothetical protein BDN72DRAFT_848328 [Pluteus cervinus]